MARIDYSSWDEKKLSVSRIKLDPQNIRLGENLGALSPKNIIAYMFQNEDIMPLVRAIALKGYFVNEMPIVVEEGGHYVVIEGNRRMTACKVLIDPNLAPSSSRPQIGHLASTFDINTLKKIKCIVAPSRDEARVIIQNRHTGGSQIEKWDGMKQDKWFVRDLNNSYSIDEIASIYLVPRSEVLISLLRYSLYREAQQVEGLDNDTFRFVHGQEKFPISTLWRIGKSNKGSSFLGLQFNSNGELEILLPKEEYHKRYAKILNDLSSRSIDSRILNKNENIDSYIEGLESSGEFDMTIMPDADRLDAISPESLDDNTQPVVLSNDGESDPEEDTPAPPLVTPAPTSADEQIVTVGSQLTLPGIDAPTSTQTRSRRKRTLIDDTYTCHTRIPRIDEIFEELQSINLNKPNSVSVLFRTLLDLLMTQLVEKLGLIERLKEEQIHQYISSNRKIGENIVKYLKGRYDIDEDPEVINRILNLKAEVDARWTPSLGLMLKFFTQNANELIPSPHHREAFLTYVRQQEILTHGDFNSFVHNPYARPNADVLEEFWASFAPFVTYVIDRLSAINEDAEAGE